MIERMFFKKAMSNIEANVGEHATQIEAELERATARLTVALIVVGALAAFAVVYAISNSGRPAE